MSSRSCAVRFIVTGIIAPKTGDSARTIIALDVEPKTKSDVSTLAFCSFGIPHKTDKPLRIKRDVSTLAFDASIRFMLEGFTICYAGGEKFFLRCALRCGLFAPPLPHFGLVSRVATRVFTTHAPPTQEQMIR